MIDEGGVQDPGQALSARHRGREAFWAGLPRDACPFASSTDEALAWVEAYEAARRARNYLDEHWERQG